MGDVLFGDYDTFRSRCAFLDVERAEEYAQEFLIQEVIDRDTLEESLKE